MSSVEVSSAALWNIVTAVALSGLLVVMAGPMASRLYDARHSQAAVEGAALQSSHAPSAARNPSLPIDDDLGAGRLQRKARLTGI